MTTAVTTAGITLTTNTNRLFGNKFQEQLDGYLTWANDKIKITVQFLLLWVHHGRQLVRMRIQVRGDGEGKLGLKDCEGVQFHENLPEANLSYGLTQDCMTHSINPDHPWHFVSLRLVPLLELISFSVNGCINSQLSNSQGYCKDQMRHIVNGRTQNLFSSERRYLMKNKIHTLESDHSVLAGTKRFGKRQRTKLIIFK